MKNLGKMGQIQYQTGNLLKGFWWDIWNITNENVKREKKKFQNGKKEKICPANKRATIKQTSNEYIAGSLI